MKKISLFSLKSSPKRSFNYDNRAWQIQSDKKVRIKVFKKLQRCWEFYLSWIFVKTFYRESLKPSSLPSGLQMVSWRYGVLASEWWWLLWPSCLPLSSLISPSSWASLAVLLDACCPSSGLLCSISRSRELPCLGKHCWFIILFSFGQLILKILVKLLVY